MEGRSKGATMGTGGGIVARVLVGAGTTTAAPPIPSRSPLPRRIVAGGPPSLQARLRAGTPSRSQARHPPAVYRTAGAVAGAGAAPVTPLQQRSWAATPLYPGCSPMHPGCSPMHPGCSPHVSPGAAPRADEQGATTRARRGGARCHRARCQRPRCHHARGRGGAATGLRRAAGAPRKQRTVKYSTVKLREGVKGGRKEGGKGRRKERRKEGRKDEGREGGRKGEGRRLP